MFISLTMYEIGRIYMIQGNCDHDIYIGSTIDTLRRRMMIHISCYNAKKRRGCSVYDIFDKYGIDNCKITLIKEYEIVDRQHLFSYESLWISKKATVNKRNPLSGWNKYMRKFTNTSESERKQDLKEVKIRETKKERYERLKGTFMCDGCNKELSSNQRLETHQAKCGKEKEKKHYKCDICPGRDFGGRKGDWRKHMKRIHNVEV